MVQRRVYFVRHLQSFEHIDLHSATQRRLFGPKFKKKYFSQNFISDYFGRKVNLKNSSYNKKSLRNFSKCN